LSQQSPIDLLSDIQILPNIDQRHAIEYLKRYYTIDELGDTIYIKKRGNNQSTIAITFEINEISLVKKVKDDQGANINEIIFERDDEEEEGEDNVY